VALDDLVLEDLDFQVLGVLGVLGALDVLVGLDVPVLEGLDVLVLEDPDDAD